MVSHTKSSRVINGKIYIGKTKGRLTTRWCSHKSNAKTSKVNIYFYNAIRKYGPENFIQEIIDNATSLAELKSREFYWIRFYNSTNPKIGYNLCYGDEEDNMVMGLRATMNRSITLKEIKIKNPRYRTPYLGVYFSKGKRCWAYCIGFQRKVEKKRFSTDKSAAIARDIRLLEFFTEIDAIKMMNFPQNIEKYKSKEIIEEQRPRLIPEKRSSYMGVGYFLINKKWEAVVIYKQKRYRISTFPTQEAAAETSDWIKISNNIPGKLNFPNINYKDPNYLPPKTCSQLFRYPKFINPAPSKKIKTRFRVRAPLKNIDSYFNSLEEAIAFQKTIL